MLTIESFVKETIKQIEEAFCGSDKEGGKTTLQHRTFDSTLAENGLLMAQDMSLVTIVEFDLAVTISSESGGQGKAHLKVFNVLEASGSGQAGKTATTANRVKFTGLARLPYASRKPSPGEQGEARQKIARG